MKNFLLSISAIAALFLSQTALADHRDHRRGYNDYGYRYNNHYSSGYDRHSYRGGNYFSFSYGDHYRHDRHHDSSSFVGGLVLGSLLSYPRYSSGNYDSVVYRSAPVVREREVVYVNRSSPTPAVGSGRRLLRDLEGNCFERNIDQQGNEIRVQLDASECKF